MSQWLFNICIDDVREVNARMLGRDLTLVNVDEWNLNQLLFAEIVSV